MVFSPMAFRSLFLSPYILLLKTMGEGCNFRHRRASRNRPNSAVRLRLSLLVLPTVIQDCLSLYKMIVPSITKKRGCQQIICNLHASVDVRGHI